MTRFLVSKKVTKTYSPYENKTKTVILYFWLMKFTVCFSDGLFIWDLCLDDLPYGNKKSHEICNIFAQFCFYSVRIFHSNDVVEKLNSGKLYLRLFC